MNAFWMLFIGMAIVIGGILVLRLHAFLALIAASLVVALLTSPRVLYRYALHAGELPLVSTTSTTTGPASADGFRIVSKSELQSGSTLLVMRPVEGPLGFGRVGVARVAAKTRDGTFAIVPIMDDPKISLPATGDIMVDPATEASARKLALSTIGERIAQGFGATALDIGIAIALAAIIGETLLQSGAAERMVLSSRRFLGDNRAGLAFMVSGYVLGIPVFFDTVFYLLVPLAKVMRLRSGKDYLLYVLAIVAGGTMTHSLVPPTPGPLMVASELKVNIATMIAGGMMVGGIAAAAGYAYALWANRRWNIPVRPSAGLSDADLATLEAGSSASLPPLWLALTPILLPVILISGDAILSAQKPTSGFWNMVAPALRTLGEKNTALAISAGIGLFMLAARPAQKPGEKSTASAVGSALSSAGVIILIISAGGAFGLVLRQTDIATLLRDILPATHMALLPLVFLVTMAVRAAQGSATVAMITAAGIISPLVATGESHLGFHPVYLALAIGCGSKPLMWMNDSGFWIIGKMSGFTERETLKSATVLMSIMGIVGLLATMAGAWLWPMA